MTPQRDIELRVTLRKHTLWLTQKQLAELFGTKVPAINKHINNIYKEGELSKKRTVSKMEIVQIEGNRKIKRIVDSYKLDMIISVGYRVNSKLATQFRIWATKILKQHILEGYTLNETRLLEAQEKFKELQSAIAFVQNKVSKKELAGQEKEILSLLSDYAKTLRIIELHDRGNLKAPRGKKATYILRYDDCEKIIEEVKRNLISKKEARDD